MPPFPCLIPSFLFSPPLPLPQVMYQIANLYELMGDINQAVEWYFQVIGLTPTDPAVLQKLGAIYDNDGDKQQAYQYNFDSYR